MLGWLSYTGFYSRFSSRASLSVSGDTSLSQCHWVKASGGAGFGIFARAREKGSIAFAKNETVLKPRGCLSLRAKQENGLYIEWLYANGKICHLDQKRYVMWSNILFNIGAAHPRIEMGLKTDDLSLFSNDSKTPQKANIKNTFRYDNKIEQPGRILKINPDKLPATCVFQAARDIMDEEEFYWHYGSDDEHYSSDQYAEASISDEVKPQVMEWTQALVSSPSSTPDEKMEFMDDEQTFDQMRWESKLKPADTVLDYTAEELHFINKMTTQIGITEVIQAAKTNNTALDAFLKFHLNRLTVFDFIKNTSNTLRDNGFSFSPEQLYEYCFSREFIIPEKDIRAVHLKWLSEKMQSDKENKMRWINILRDRITAVIIQPEFSIDVVLRTLKSSKVPNPLRDDRPDWMFCDLINLTGHAGNILRNQAQINALISAYRECPDRYNNQTVWTLAHMGNPDAVAAIMEAKFFQQHATLQTISEVFLRKNILVPVDGEMKPATHSNLIWFINHFFPEAKAIKMIPAVNLEGSAFDHKMTARCSRSAFSKSMIHKINQIQDREDEQLALFKELIFKKGNLEKPPSATNLLIGANTAAKNIPSLPKPLMAHHLCDLFPEPEHQEWLCTIFPICMTSNEQLLERMIQVTPHQRGPYKNEILRRCQSNPKLIGPFLKAFERASGRGIDKLIYSLTTDFEKKSVVAGPVR